MRTRTRMRRTAVALLAALALPSPAIACTLSWDAASWMTVPEAVPAIHWAASGYLVYTSPLVGTQTEASQNTPSTTLSCASLSVPDGPVKVQVSAYLDYQGPAVGTGPLPPLQRFESTRSNILYLIKGGAPTNLKLILEFTAQ
jgi:hypothetical protein